MVSKASPILINSLAHHDAKSASKIQRSQITTSSVVFIGQDIWIHKERETERETERQRETGAHEPRSGPGWYPQGSIADSRPKDHTHAHVHPPIMAAHQTMKLGKLVPGISSMEFSFTEKPGGKDAKKLREAVRAQIERVMVKHGPKALRHSRP